MVVGALDGHGAEVGIEGLGMPPGEVRRAPAGAGPRAGLAVGMVSVETPLDRPCRQLQGAAPHTALDRLEVELVDCLGGYEAGDFGL